MLRVQVLAEAANFSLKNDIGRVALCCITLGVSMDIGMTLDCSTPKELRTLHRLCYMFASSNNLSLFF